jgi:hypothetical protein
VLRWTRWLVKPVCQRFPPRYAGRFSEDGFAAGGSLDFVENKQPTAGIFADNRVWILAYFAAWKQSL